MEQATILIVDDEPEVLQLLREYLTDQGYHVVTATNGLEALFQVTRRRPQAVVLDLFMPRLGGLGVLDPIRRLDPGVVIILISGVPNAVEMVTEAGVSVAGAFAKPLDVAALMGKLVEAGVLPSKRPMIPASEARSRTDALFGSRRALVVDDESEVRQVLVEYLQGKGFEALDAANGEEALYRIPEFRPHVVLLDIAMPGLSGVETLRRIKALPLKTCVVMVSGIDDLEAARETLAVGAADYLPKPVDFQYLDTVLEVHMLMDEFDIGSR